MWLLSCPRHEKTHSERLPCHVTCRPQRRTRNPKTPARAVSAFDAILAEKHTLIKTLKDGPAILAADPSLETLVARIQDADKAAQRLLYQKVGQVMREMNRVNRQEQARSAYHQPAPSATPKPIGFLPDTPMFMDARS